MTNGNPAIPEFKDWKLCLLGGIIFVILGIAALSVPGIITVTFTFILAWILLLGGIGQLILTFSREGIFSIILSLLSAIVLFVTGFMMLTRPLLALVTLTTLLSIYLFVQGILQIVTSLSLRPLKNWGWMLFTGILAILLGAMIWCNWPTNMVAFLGIIVGIYLLVWGIAEIILAFSVRTLQK